MHSSAIAGACAGLVSSVVTCPLDVVKTRLQAQEGRRPTGKPAPGSMPSSALAGPSSIKKLGPEAAAVTGDMALEQGARYMGLADTLKRIWRDDGIRGFYRGLGPTIFGYLPTWAIYFTVYDTCKQVLAHDISGSGEEDFLNHILSAMTAGAASTVCTSPLWVVKTRFMLQSGRDKSTRPYRHTGDAFVQIFRTEGLGGFYKGLLPSLFGVSHVAVQFPLYEAFKSYAREAQATNLGVHSEELSPSTILACSSSAKMIASVTTYPHEVLRTRLQMHPRGGNRSAPSSSPSPTTTTTATATATTARPTPTPPPPPPPTDPARFTVTQAEDAIKTRYSGLVQACRTIAKEEGWRGFYKGMAVNLVRTVPSSALTILTYEVIMQHLTQDHSPS